MNLHWNTRSHGFTLIEIVIGITIVGFLVGVVGMFMTRPIDAYITTERRAELSDAADVATRRLGRELRSALPNSVRLSGNCLEFIATSSGGRYRDQPDDGSTAGDSLSFSSVADLSFDVLGLSSVQPPIRHGDYIVVNNLGISAVDAYAGGNRARVSGVATFTANPITLGSNPFAAQSPPRPSPTAQFQVVPGTHEAVSYVCTGGELRRYAQYGFNATQVCPPGGGSSLLVAANASCQMAISNTLGLVFFRLTLSDSKTSDSATLFQQYHVSNVP